MNKAMTPLPMGDDGDAPAELVLHHSRSEGTLAALPGVTDLGMMIAQKVGRSMATFRDELESWACLDEETARSCTYDIPQRSGQPIVGANVRFAELAHQAYKHLVTHVEVIDEGETKVRVRCTGQDLCRNTTMTNELTGGILGRDGRRYSRDMIDKTTGALLSKVYRNVVLKMIPKAIWHEVWLKCRAVAQGQTRDGVAVIPHKERRAKAFEYLAAFGADRAMLLAFLERESLEDVTPEDVTKLKAVAEKVRSGEVPVEEAFAPPEKGEAAEGQDAATKAAERLSRAEEAAGVEKPKAARRTKPKARPAQEAPPADEGDEDVPEV